MPLKSGKGKKAHSSNVKELLTKFKETGKIGTSHPANVDAAMKQANAISFAKSRKGKKK